MTCRNQPVAGIRLAASRPETRHARGGPSSRVPETAGRDDDAPAKPEASTRYVTGERVVRVRDVTRTRGDIVIAGRLQVYIYIYGHTVGNKKKKRKKTVVASRFTAIVILCVLLSHELG